VSHSNGTHSPRWGINLIHEPVLDGAFAANQETLFVFPNDPSFYAANPSQFSLSLGCTPPPPAGITCTATAAGNGSFVQSVRRLGLYGQDSWRVTPRLALNYGLRYDTTFGLFRASGREQNQNPALLTLRALGLPLVNGMPHDYRGALAPRLGIAYAPGSLGKTAIRAGFGLYFNDLAQNGWATAFQAVDAAPGPCLVPSDPGCLAPGQPGALIDPRYRTPYALQVSSGVEHEFSDSWRLNVHYEHQQGTHQYRRYEYVSGFTLPSTAPSISLFRTDNRSRYDGITFLAQHRLSNHFELVAHYTLASAATWGGPVGELFDYVNGVTDVRNPFGPGDHGPSGEDVRHRFVVAGVFQLPYQFEVSTLSQLESARPYTLATSVDVNNDGNALNDRAVVNGAQTSLNEFRGTPFMQVDLRVSREFRYKERLVVRPFVELFNLFNRVNPGNNFITNLAALPIPVSELGNATDICLDPACTMTRPIRSLGDLRQPAGALGDFFGPGTTVGLSFAAQFGVRISF
jgi:TonB dependent receptor